MPWDRSQPVDPKYRSKAHRAERAKYVRQMEREGYLICQQPVCLNPSRVILPGDRWHLGHDDSGTQYIGPVCARCNVVDGAKRARARQDNPKPSRWVM